MAAKLEEKWELMYQEVATELRSKLSPNLLFHGPSHTLVDVLPAAERLGAIAKLNPDEYLLLRIGALYHDTGFLDEYKKNEPQGSERAATAMRRHGFSEKDIEVVNGIIMATQLPQSPKTFVEELMCDSDLSHLSHATFFLKTELLRLELSNYGIKMEPRAWSEDNIKFLSEHKYHTEIAQKLFQKGKEENIRMQKELIHGKSS